MKKIITVIFALSLLCSCTKPVSNPIMTPETITPTPTVATPEPKKESSLIAVESGEGSFSKKLTEVAAFDTELLSDEDLDTITLYTSASKENGRFVWDDSAEWILEVCGSDGKFYQLFDERVSNGNIYFDVVQLDDKKYIMLHNISTAANYIKTYCVSDGQLCETDEVDLNLMKDEAVNLMFTSIPFYR